MANLLQARSRNRIWYLLAFVATLAAGLASRRVPHIFPEVLGKYPGDVLWALMIYFGMGAVFNKFSSLDLGCRVLGFCFWIELLKLWQAPWLVSVRHSTLGHLIFGHVFSWQNLAAYSVGIVAGLALEVLVMPRPAPPP